MTTTIDILEFTDEEINSLEDTPYWTFIYNDYDHPDENPWDTDSNYSIYLDINGDYWTIGYNYSKDRGWESLMELTNPKTPPIQGPTEEDISF